MNTRPVAAAFFVVFCLLLCGLILRRQIAAHPLPPDRRQSFSDGRQFGGGGQGLDGDFRGWHPASGPDAAQVHSLLQAEMAALAVGNASKAMTYQSRFLRTRFSDPRDFLQAIFERHPELVDYHRVLYNPVWTDQKAQNAIEVIFIEGRRGERAQDAFELVREGGQFKINHIRTHMP